MALSLFSTLPPGLREHKTNPEPGSTVPYHNNRATSPSLNAQLLISADARPTRFAEVSHRFYPCLSTTDNARRCPQTAVFPAE